MDGVIQAVQENALLLAVVLPPAIRVAGHWLPEEPLMVAMGVLVASSEPRRAVLLVVLLWASHALTDNVLYLAGRRLGSRLGRWPRVERRVAPVIRRAGSSPWMLLMLVPARVLPLGRGAWLLGFGAARVPAARFITADVLAVAVHLLVWVGLGFWVGPRAGDLLHLAKPASLWLVAAVVLSAVAVLAWRRYSGTPSATPPQDWTSA